MHRLDSRPPRINGCGDPEVPSHEASSYLRRAASDLSSALAGAAPNVAAYRRAIQQLRQLASLPETGDTSTQKSEARTDLLDLNSFFATEGLYE